MAKVANSGSFKPGICPNPGGKPKDPAKKLAADVKALAKEHTEAAIKTLVSVMQSTKAAPAARVAAASAVLDRGHGKPLQTIDATLNVFDKLDDAQQQALLAALDALAPSEAGVGGGTPSTHH